MLSDQRQHNIRVNDCKVEISCHCPGKREGHASNSTSLHERGKCTCQYPSPWHASRLICAGGSIGSAAVDRFYGSYHAACLRIGSNARGSVWLFSCACAPPPPCRCLQQTCSLPNCVTFSTRWMQAGPRCDPVLVTSLSLLSVPLVACAAHGIKYSPMKVSLNDYFPLFCAILRYYPCMPDLAACLLVANLTKVFSMRPMPLATGNC